MILGYEIFLPVINVYTFFLYTSHACDSLSAIIMIEGNAIIIRVLISIMNKTPYNILYMDDYFELRKYI